MANPQVNPAVGLSPVEGGYLAYDPLADRLHELNATAALIAELCDGSRSVQQIRALAGPLMPEGHADQIDPWIDEAIAAGLLIWTDAAPARPRELSLDELTQLVEHLRESNRIEPALLCAKKVTDLAPDDPIAWHTLGRVALAAGDRNQARTAYARYLAHRPQDAAIRHLLIALRDEPPPPRASDECILQVFNEFSSYFDSKMREDLLYRGPEQLYDLIASEIGSAGGLEILDLGCGTGLAGIVLKDRAARLTGIDLSPDMIEFARGRGIYDQLEAAEVTAWLDRTQVQFDLIVACDCFVYFGDLRPVTALAAQRLKPGGIFAFTMELGERYPFHLADTGRYTHHPGHIRDAAAHAGLSVARLEEQFLRMEAGVEVTGLMALLRKSFQA
jgi:predicted TPR repeat methyltransferase